MVGEPKDCKSRDDEQNQATALSFTLEHGTSQAADDRGVAGVDESEGHQASHNGLKNVLENRMSHTPPVVKHTTAHVVRGTLENTVRELKGKDYEFTKRYYVRK